MKILHMLGESKLDKKKTNTGDKGYLRTSSPQVMKIQFYNKVT